MKVLVIGSGGREHAIAEAFTKSKAVSEVVVAPGNAGIALRYRCEPITAFTGIRDFCQREGVGLVFIGPEQPIEQGLSDYLNEHKIPVFAPSKAAARLETSKIFAKQLMQEKGIPTAAFTVVNHPEDAEAALQEFSYPLVIKADGLAAGKGVTIAQDKQAALQAISDIFRSELQTNEGVIVEEHLTGWEVSLFAVCDGMNYVSTIFVQDHKQLYDNDKGPNTGGMGAYAPVPAALAYQTQIENDIVAPVLQAMRELGSPYMGILYCGLMITETGAKVVEFNCRLGDPEAQVLLPLLQSDLLEICQNALCGKIRDMQISFMKKTALGVVLASEGYPAKYRKGMRIEVPTDMKEGIFFSGVSSSGKGLIGSGGRILCVVGMGDDLLSARQHSYEKLKRISMESGIYRNDIGLRTNQL